MKNTKSDNIVASVNGLDIKEGAIYKVLHKPDSTGLDGYAQEGATKLPSEGVMEVFQCKYVMTDPNNRTGVWDTGFYPESPCYANIDEKEAKVIVKALKDNIVTPYERKYGVGILSHENDTFWNAKYFVLEEGGVFDMSNVEQRLTLYMAMRNRKLTPSDKINDVSFRGSFYCIQDVNKVRNRNIDRMADEMRAGSMFTTLGKTNQNLLKAVMSYVGFAAFSADSDEKTRLGMFGNWLKSDANNVYKFLEAIDLSEDKANSDVLFIYYKLPLAVKRKIIEREQGVYVYKSELLAGDLKTVARRINSTPEFEDLKLEILELE